MRIAAMIAYFAEQQLVFILLRFHFVSEVRMLQCLLSCDAFQRVFFQHFQQ